MANCPAILGSGYALRRVKAEDWHVFSFILASPPVLPEATFMAYRAAFATSYFLLRTDRAGTLPAVRHRWALNWLCRGLRRIALTIRLVGAKCPQLLNVRVVSARTWCSISTCSEAFCQVLFRFRLQGGRKVLSDLGLLLGHDR